MSEPQEDNTSWITQDELDELQTSGLTRETPFLIRGVSGSIFSVARHSGGAVFQGAHYLYIPPTDELIRQDVVTWAEKRRKNQKAFKKDDIQGTFDLTNPANVTAIKRSMARAVKDGRDTFGVTLASDGGKFKATLAVDYATFLLEYAAKVAEANRATP